jgi:hypothetical protein
MSGWRKRQIKEQVMRDEHKHLYTVKWTQPYDPKTISIGLHEMAEALSEFALSNSDYKEARELIAKIKSTL